MDVAGRSKSGGLGGGDGRSVPGRRHGGGRGRRGRANAALSASWSWPPEAALILRRSDRKA